MMGVADYLASYYPQLVDLRSLVDSLEASLQGGRAELEGRRAEYREHLPEHTLLEGVKKVSVSVRWAWPGGRCEVGDMRWVWPGGRYEVVVFSPTRLSLPRDSSWLVL